MGAKYVQESDLRMGAKYVQESGPKNLTWVDTKSNMGRYVPS